MKLKQAGLEAVAFAHESTSAARRPMWQVTGRTRNWFTNPEIWLRPPKELRKVLNVIGLREFVARKIKYQAGYIQWGSVRIRPEQRDIPEAPAKRRYK